MKQATLKPYGIGGERVMSAVLVTFNAADSTTNSLILYWMN